jgi:hypothetical protein
MEPEKVETLTALTQVHDPGLRRLGRQSQISEHIGQDS